MSTPQKTWRMRYKERGLREDDTPDNGLHLGVSLCVYHDENKQTDNNGKLP
eukprot:m.32863 g.32863  ORF g.32863 m.32863 type:complete len:51 (+) comp16716_c0_seq1:110-262(+)